ncbi:Fructose-1,6-bisphosphatase, chloroplastic [Porphyridium purpureum]|uniref:fructose-bisphosphatase n=1 Tax=Porphyridium purpureum TaxID=35688 RepID=A0A5J4YI26_PORPP|nr:Fructose-1,6-bisphosphatase, chloroplastic [Porphyridium purpureum]|eukprot:POR4797..scf251_18
MVAFIGTVGTTSGRARSVRPQRCPTRQRRVLVKAEFFDAWSRRCIPEPNLRKVVDALQNVAIELAEQIGAAPITKIQGHAAGMNASGDSQKELDVIANHAFKRACEASGCVSVMASEEDEQPVEIPSTIGPGDVGIPSYVVCFDPLDGSRNIESSIPTGSIFGIYAYRPDLGVEANVLQPGINQVAAGYILFSSATQMVLTTGSGAHIFTVDWQTRRFVCTSESIHMPKRGQVYSLNDARYFDWPKGLQDYIDTIRQGKGENAGKKYSARYVCSLVADFHRTLYTGGWAGNPRSHLRLVYEANPLAFIAEQAHGRGSDGKRRILEIQPAALHQRLPLFLGSSDDLNELEKYDVQQKDGSYDV